MNVRTGREAKACYLRRSDRSNTEEASLTCEGGECSESVVRRGRMCKLCWESQVNKAIDRSNESECVFLVVIEHVLHFEIESGNGKSRTKTEPDTFGKFQCVARRSRRTNVNDKMMGSCRGGAHQTRLV